MRSVIKHPSAWIPLASSLVMVVLWIALFVIAGTPRPQPDEGAAAHLFQIWLVLEMVMVGFFAVKWLPQKPKPALVVLLIQIVGIVLVCAPVAYFHL